MLSLRYHYRLPCLRYDKEVHYLLAVLDVLGCTEVCCFVLVYSVHSILDTLLFNNR